MEKEVIRSVNVKFIIPQGDGPRARDTRRQLDGTHERFNAVTADWERYFLELRQRDVAVGRDDDGREIIEPGELWRERLAARIGHEKVARHADDLHILYRVIFPGYVERGGASSGVGASKIALQQLRPMATSGSQGGLRQFDVLAHFGWLPGKCAPKPPKGNPKKTRVSAAVRKRVERYIEANPKALKPIGAPPAWVLHWHAGKPDWPELLLGEVETKQKMLGADHAVIPRLHAAGVLPLLPPMLSLVGQKTSVSPWDVAAYGIAAANVSGWESDRHDMIANVAHLEANLEHARQQDLASSGGARAALDAIERDLGHVLGGREIWGWRDLRDWLRAGSDDFDTLLAKLIAEHGRRVRSPQMLKQLAAVSEFYATERDPVWTRVKLNDATRRLERAHRLPLYTAPHPTEHPQWVDYDSPANTNKPQFNMQQKKGKLTATIPLLRETDAGLVEECYHFSVVPTGQLDDLQLRREGKWLVASFRSQDRLERREALIGGARLMHKEGEGTWLKLSLKLDVDSEAATERGKNQTFFSRAPVNRQGPRPTARVLAVDLRVRCVGGCVVYDATGARERTFMLRLPGEGKVGRKERERRAELDAEIKGLRERVKEVNHAARECLKTATTPEKAAAVANHFSGKEAPKEVREFFQMEEQVGCEISALRRGDRNVGGQRSMWRVSYLDKLLSLLKAWDRHGRIVSKRETSRAGVGRKLQEHLNALKDDRAKTAADLIVQSALGRVRQNHKWVQKYEPVDIIVIDGLHLYKTNSHLPRDENGQMMRWCHRAISQSVEHQAELAGIAVTESATYYSSRFHAPSGAPGAPCRRLTEADVQALETSGKEHRLWKLVAGLGGTPEEIRALQPGAFVPDVAGPVFISVGPNGPIQLNTTINAVGNNGQWYLAGTGSPPYSLAPFKIRDGVMALVCEQPRVRSLLQCRVVTFKQARDGTWMLRRHRTIKAAEKALGCPLTVPQTGQTVRVFTDPTGQFFLKGRWVERARFWDHVRGVILEQLGLIENAA